MGSLYFCLLEREKEEENLSIYLSSTYLSIYLPTCLSVCLPDICLPTYLSVYPISVCLSVYLPVSVCLFLMYFPVPSAAGDMRK